MTTNPTPVPPAPPVACTLGPRDYEARIARLGALAERALRSRAAIDGGARLTFRDSPDVERDLRAAVAAEASCCPFMTMRLERRGEGLVLDVTGPPEAEPVIAALFA